MICSLCQVLVWCSSAAAGQFQWRLVNGLWALFLAFGTVLTSLKVETARSWRFLTGPLRSFLADYGVVLSVVLWSCLSYALQGAPPGVPRRLALPNTWDVTTTWTVTGVRSVFPAPLQTFLGHQVGKVWAHSH